MVSNVTGGKGNGRPENVRVAVILAVVVEVPFLLIIHVQVRSFLQAIKINAASVQIKMEFS
ncbi:MAG: hypothetical protein HYX39_11155 [Bacteroidetes bacterium]|nr:hypothetical protein [Bacteroidota bacterium]